MGWRQARRVNAHYLKGLPDASLLALAKAQLGRRGVAYPDDAALLQASLVFRERCNTGAELAGWLAMLWADVAPSPADLAQYVGAAIRPALATLAGKLASTEWSAGAINAAVKETLAAHGLKMPQLAPAVRVVVCGRAQTPSLDAVLALFPAPRCWSGCGASPAPL